MSKLNICGRCLNLFRRQLILLVLFVLIAYVVVTYSLLVSSLLVPFSVCYMDRAARNKRYNTLFFFAVAPLSAVTVKIAQLYLSLCIVSTDVSVVNAYLLYCKVPPFHDIAALCCMAAPL